MPDSVVPENEFVRNKKGKKDKSKVERSQRDVNNKIVRGTGCQI